MKSNQLFRMATVGVLWLFTNAGCRKEALTAIEPASQGVVCCKPGNQFVFLETLSGVRADVAQYGVRLKEPVQGLPGIGVCCNSRTKIDSLQSSWLKDPLNPTFKYKIWGKVYNLPNVVSLVPSYYVDIYRIEEAQ